MNNRIVESVFWKPLTRHYRRAPSIALCRVPELEFASQLDVSGSCLDHCCGDGLFAALAWQGKKLSAGCDINHESIAQAQRRAHHLRLDVCDVSVRLPYADHSFDLVFDNSALEHVKDLRSNLAEIARVLKPKGKFAFNVLNHRYFEWWPLDKTSLEGYKQWQPFFHALSKNVWQQELEAVGLEIVTVKGYFDQRAAQELARLDYAFSAYYLKGVKSSFVRSYLALPGVFSSLLFRKLQNLVWETPPDAGAGFSILAVKRDG
ncbi:MAG: class I SAM-dependent methyltransferase [Anaerolineae bacterium]|nr:class I SAM-dependent methyltransferase [Anaerolineae bacterium]